MNCSISTDSISQSSHDYQGVLLTSNSFAALAAVGLFASVSVALGAIVLSGHGTLLGVVGVVGDRAAYAFIILGGATLLSEFAIVSCCYAIKRNTSESIENQSDEKIDSPPSDPTESLSDEENPAFQNFLKENQKAFLDVQKALPQIPLKERELSLEPGHGHYTKIKNGKAIFSPVYSLRRSAKDKLAGQLDYAIRSGFTHLKGFNLTITSKNLSRFQDNKIQDKRVGAASAWNPRYRKEMEDAHIFTKFSFKFQGEVIRVKIACVCDGHGDDGAVAQYVSNALPKRIEEILMQSENLDDTNITNAITEAFVTIEQRIHELNLTNGTTVTCAFFINRQIYVINCGDSGTLLVKKNIAYKLTEDAKPDLPRFIHTIRNMERRIFLGKVEGVLCVARDLGISDVSPRPKITSILRGKKDDNLEEMRIYYQDGDFLVLACDGLWDVANIEEILASIQVMDAEGLTPKEMSSQLVYNALQNGSKDNITVIVIRL